jgi:DNA mismatch repair protein MutS
MQNDKTTLRDLSIFTSDGSGSVFALLDHATTQAGRDMLRRHIQHPPESFEQLCQVQQAIIFMSQNPDAWPKIILNGTLVMLDKFYESADTISAPPSGLTLLLSSFFQRVLHKQEYFLTQFSLSHVSDFLKGCMQLADIGDMPGVPALLKREANQIKEELQHRLVPEVIGITQQTKYSDLSQLSYKVRREMKNMIYRLVNSYARLDAWHAMAIATVTNKWVFPKLLPPLPVRFEATGITHPLLRQPIAYDTSFDNDRNFLLLTGANMSGKTTFMRALGVNALLAHLGMGVAATSLRISFLQGVITNMQTEDNIVKGESYFFAEVQRMKQTAEKLSHRQPHLVLMDELFKGTNVHDAYECTKAVVEGLLHHPTHLMILSTHLYEVAQQFSNNTGIQFSYFVTNLGSQGNYEFTYQLRSGISNDRIGYLILQQEGVIDLLHKGTSSR